ncbi:MAG: anaerobic ribonucleoside-triphosphate reductase activating protein [Candidatus Omnitrophota bacterium]|jgi:pyruvate formate lyase activating enzyme
MKIAGFQKLSLVDYPGYLAAVVFVQGCNFRCPYCQNPDLVTLEKRFDCSQQEILDYISARKNMVEGLVITGGEPTIYDDLPDFIKRVKNAGVKLKLDTNGANPDQLKELLKSGLLDFVALDIKTSPSKYGLVADSENAPEAVSESIRMLMSSRVPYEFRTTCVPGIVDKEDLSAIVKLISGAEKYCLQQFRPIITFESKFQDVKPYSKETLEDFRSILSASVKSVEIRGI